MIGSLQGWLQHVSRGREVFEHFFCSDFFQGLVQICKTVIVGDIVDHGDGIRRKKDTRLLKQDVQAAWRVSRGMDDFHCDIGGCLEDLAMG